MKTGTELYPDLLNSSHNLTCHVCLQQITYRGNDILCGCEVRPEYARGTEQSQKPESPALTTGDVQKGELMAMRVLCFVCLGVVAGVVWFHGLGAWVAPQWFIGGH